MQCAGRTDQRAALVEDLEAMSAEQEQHKLVLQTVSLQRRSEDLRE